MAKKKSSKEKQLIKGDTLKLSPYTTIPYDIYIGVSGQKYTLLKAIVDQNPFLSKRVNPSNSSIRLPEVDEEAGHTLLHYLYTGRFEIFQSNSASKEISYKRNVMVYHAAKIFGITSLEILAKEQLQTLVNALSVIQIQQILAKSRLFHLDPWFIQHIKERLTTEFASTDKLLTPTGVLMSLICKCTVFERAAVQSIAENYLRVEKENAKTLKQQAHAPSSELNSSPRLLPAKESQLQGHNSTFADDSGLRSACKHGENDDETLADCVHVNGDSMGEKLEDEDWEIDGLVV